MSNPSSKKRKHLSPSPSPSLLNQTQSKKQKTFSKSITLIQTSNEEDVQQHFHTSISNCRYQKRTKTIKQGESDRQWIFSSHNCSSFKDKVVIASYNILGVENASNHLYLYNRVSPQFMNWVYRKMRIRKELKRYKAHILCFQEVDRFPDLAKLLKEDGFNGVYKARTGEACDGCAIFWKEELFTLMHQEHVEFREFNLRDNVAQFCVLKMKLNHSNKDPNAQTSRSRTLLVGNTHVLFNPKRGDIKLGQVRLFVEKAHTLSQEWGNIPVVLAGDLNSMPQSAIYQFLAASELEILHHDRAKLSGQIEGSSRSKTRVHHEVANSWSKEELQLAAGSERVTRLQHHLQLCSAYIGVPGSFSTRDRYGEPLATSHHSNFMGTVDYIWHSKELIPLGVVETLPVDILRKTGLPSEKWGSDHLALVCELAFVDERNGT